MSRTVPRKEAELIKFANSIISGLKAKPDIFNNPPVNYNQIKDIADEFKASKEDTAQKKAAYKNSLIIKDKNFKTLYNNLVYVAKYCIRTAKNNKSALTTIGLKYGRKTPEAPGQCLNLTITKQKIGAITLTWKKPRKCGAVRAYIIQRKESDVNSNKWENIWTEHAKQVKIKNQPEGKTFDYRVRSINTLGLGLPSNVVSAKF